MSESLAREYEKVEVAVNIISKPGLIMTVFNEKWAAFTLPMTKIRKWHDPASGDDIRVEEPLDAATRVAGELRGRTFSRDELPQFVSTLADVRQSDRTGEFKLYSFHVFNMVMHPDEPLRPGLIAEWLERDDILEGRVFPVSPTVQFILEKL